MSNSLVLRSCLAVVALGATLLASAHGRRTTARPRLESARSLLAEARHDAGVRARYERHFGMERGRLYRFLRELRPGTLEQGGRYLVYCSNARGEETALTATLSKDEPTLVDETGRSVLLANGGDPIEASGLVDATDETLAPRTSTAAPAAVATPLAASFAPTPAPLPVPRTSTAFGAGGASSLLVLTTVVPFSLGFVIDPNGNQSVQSVPEPATAAALALGSLAFLRRRRKA